MHVWPGARLETMSGMSTKLLALIAAVLVLGAAGTASAAGTTLSGKWVATVASKKIVLTLHKAGAVYKGTTCRRERRTRSSRTAAARTGPRR